MADFTVTEGQRFPFTLVWYPSHEEPPPPLDSYYAVHLTEACWTEWAAQLLLRGPLRATRCVRSLITLKALTYEPTGGIVAAATTSLPEALGRQPQLGLPLLLAARRHADPRVAHARRLLRRGHGLARLAAAGRRRRRLEAPDHVRAGRRAPARRVGGSTGCPATRARPRCGSATPPPGQYQLDVYGEVMSALYASAHSRGRAQPGRLGPADAADRVPRDGLAASPTTASGRCAGPRRHFTHSKVMAWVAVDRAVRTLEEWPDLDGPDREVAGAARRDLRPRSARRGTTRSVGAFTQYYGSDELDASVLMIPLVGFLPAERPPGREHGRGHRARAHRRRLRAALPHRRRRRGRRADRPRRAPSWPARSGWSTACT